MVLWVGLQFVIIVVFPDYTHLRFLIKMVYPIKRYWLETQKRQKLSQKGHNSVNFADGR